MKDSEVEHRVMGGAGPNINRKRDEKLTEASFPKCFISCLILICFPLTEQLDTKICSLAKG